MKKTVVHMSSVHPRSDSRIFYKQCIGAVSQGFEVSLVVADGLGRDCISGINIFDVGIPKNRIYRIFRTTNNVFKTALKINADLYHLHDPELLPVGLRLKMHGKRVIFDSHEDVPIQLETKHYLSPKVAWFLARAYEIFQKFVGRRIDGVITATPFIRDKFLKINSATVDICNYPILGEFEMTLPWSQKEQEVCYVGNISKHRGIQEITHAIGLVREPVKLILGGEFAEEGLWEEVRNLNGWKRINVLGSLDRQGVRKVLDRARVGLVTLHPIKNYVDALPIKMFEYMAAGIPVVASNFPSWREIVEGNECGICVDPLKPQEIAEAIEYLLRDQLSAQKMGSNGARLARYCFNWAVEEKKLLNFYRSILGIN